MKRLALWALRLAPFGATCACVAWFLAYAPFAAPMVERTSTQVGVAINRAMVREVTPRWMRDHVQIAIINEDLIEMEMLVDLSVDTGVPIDPAMLRDMGEIVEAQSGWVARAGGCGACAVDITQCSTLAQIGACALPFEMTPAGDLNALRRAGVAYARGGEVDQWDVGLALVGLGATGAIVVSGGSSTTVKVGASLMRAARRIGSLTPAFTRMMGDMLRVPVNWGRLPAYVAGRAPLGEVTDVARLARVQAVAADLGRIRRNTSTAETLVLMRHIDSPADAARVARVSDVMGPKTRTAFEVLGKSRVFRAMVRLGDLAIGAAVAIYALGLQLLVFAGQQCGNMCLRALRRALT